MTKRLPKWGFTNNAFREPLDTISFQKLYYYIEKDRLDTSVPITIRALFECGALSSCKYGLKLLGGGSNKIDRPLHFELSDASKSAIDAVKAANGSVKCIFRTTQQVKYHIKPDKFNYPQRDTSMPSQYDALKMQKIEERGAEVKYIKPPWLDSYETPEIPEIPPKQKTKKPVVVKKIDFGL